MIVRRGALRLLQALASHRLAPSVQGVGRALLFGFATTVATTSAAAAQTSGATLLPPAPAEGRGASVEEPAPLASRHLPSNVVFGCPPERPVLDCLSPSERTELREVLGPATDPATLRAAVAMMSTRGYAFGSDEVRRSLLRHVHVRALASAADLPGFSLMSEDRQRRLGPWLERVWGGGSALLRRSIEGHLGMIPRGDDDLFSSLDVQHQAEELGRWSAGDFSWVTADVTALRLPARRSRKLPLGPPQVLDDDWFSRSVRVRGRDIPLLYRKEPPSKPVAEIAAETMSEALSLVPPSRLPLLGAIAVQREALVVSGAGMNGEQTIAAAATPGGGFDEAMTFWALSRTPVEFERRPGRPMSVDVPVMPTARELTGTIVHELVHKALSAVAGDRFHFEQLRNAASGAPPLITVSFFSPTTARLDFASEIPGDGLSVSVHPALTADEARRQVELIAAAVRLLPTDVLKALARLDLLLGPTPEVQVELPRDGRVWGDRPAIVLPEGTDVTPAGLRDLILDAMINGRSGLKPLGGHYLFRLREARTRDGMAPTLHGVGNLDEYGADVQAVLDDLAGSPDEPIWRDGFKHTVAVLEEAIDAALAYVAKREAGRVGALAAASPGPVE